MLDFEAIPMIFLIHYKDRYSNINDPYSNISDRRVVDGFISQITDPHKDFGGCPLSHSHQIMHPNSRDLIFQPLSLS